MHWWRRAANEKWFGDHESELRALAGDRLVIIERPNRRRLQLEVTNESREQLEKLAKRFGGRIEKLQPNWLKRFLRKKTKPIKVGNARLIIPAGTAFGTGEHATTAMSLGLLERVMKLWGAQAPSPALFGASPKSLKSSRSRRRDRQHARRVRSPDLVVDLGCGSGILALAAKRLGAKRAVGIDNDPIATSTAKANARLNKIRGVRFRLGDVRQWKPPGKSRLRRNASPARTYGAQVDIVTANLFSELMIEILPKLKTARRLILSGILRNQERDIRRALTRHKIDIIEVRRRGKWIAILACSGAL